MAFPPNTARCLFTSSHPCNRCGAVSVASIALAYTDSDTKSLIMHTFTPCQNFTDGLGKICLGRTKPEDDVDEALCPGFKSAEEQLHEIENVATWEQLDSSSLAGIREMTRLRPRVSGSGSRSMEIRRRGANRVSESSSSLDDDWEAWLMSIAGQSMSCMINRSGQRTRLAVSTVGPAQKIGTGTVAIAYGNSVVVLTTGGEEYSSSGHTRRVYDG
jgi:hypothetical protein